MTRAKEELYLCHARMRDFRGNTNYTVPSMFLQELPADVHGLDFSDTSGGAHHAIDFWRDGGGPAARQGWTDAGIPPRPAPVPPRRPATTGSKDFAEGMAVRHPKYGTGTVVEVSGYGALRRVKVRFATAGVLPFVILHAPLEIIEGA